MDGSGGTAEQSFASYLAKALIARKGYRLGTVPEAQELLAHCDAVLTLSYGLTMSIVAIVDREAKPWRRFELSKEELDRIGMDCLRYTGAGGGRKLPVDITVIEVGEAAVAAEEKERLKPLRSISPLSKVLISAVAAGPSTRELWTNAAPTARAMLLFIRGLMNQPRGDL